MCMYFMLTVSQLYKLETTEQCFSMTIFYRNFEITANYLFVNKCHFLHRSVSVMSLMLQLLSRPDVAGCNNN